MIYLTHESGEDANSIEVQDTGIFGGVFACYGSDGNALGGGPANSYSCEIDESGIATTQDFLYREDWAKIQEVIRDELYDNPTEDEINEIANVVCEDRDADIETERLSELLLVENEFAYVSWGLQRLRGKLAAALGYRAVEMSDENGTSVLILPGVKMARIVNCSRLRA